MKPSATYLFTNLHLAASIALVVPTGIIYGSPSLMPAFLDIQVETVDLANMLKANMALYLGVSAVWLAGMLKSTLWQRATELNVLFMLTLSGGRLLSMATDGLPTDGYIFGVIAELAIGAYALYQPRQHHARAAPEGPSAARRHV